MKVELVEVFVALALLRNSEGDKDKGLSQSPKRTTEKSKMRSPRSLSPMAGFFSLLRRLYLSLYNWTVLFGWCQVLYFVLKTLNESGHQYVYNAAEKPLLYAQTAAVLEILHGLVGLVRSPVTATLPQISSRLFLVWGILWSFPETRSHVLVTSLLISWSITEAKLLVSGGLSLQFTNPCFYCQIVEEILRCHKKPAPKAEQMKMVQLEIDRANNIIRYSFFGFKETFGFTPSWLLWLRYSSFLVLYPTGISSEVGLIYIALPFIKASEKYCIRMPNKLNSSFDYFYAAIVAMGIYVPGMNKTSFSLLLLMSLG
ncbi:Very-long-chain (3R)-3-hydroxyacyl-CoA dehydratase PASTICCINO 2A isoform B [Glycine soja]|uniref:Very-long-chain (3R)-3-hydroxyacyl-CoA dehydratase n=1 Tax=Glycine soja TaxID=3848 RepID=A0A445JLD6_GLYSO|nr:Very-long-chain (3R)-3-hydroxyacyl-CoA dehydratase PASTICCINO 2A isoform B [Glycine soja]